MSFSDITFLSDAGNVDIMSFEINLPTEIQKVQVVGKIVWVIMA